MKQKKVGKTFIKHIPYIETVIFSVGSYFSGHEVTTVRFQDDRALFTASLMSCSSSAAVLFSMASGAFNSSTASAFTSAALRSFSSCQTQDLHHTFPSKRTTFFFFPQQLHFFFISLLPPTDKAHVGHLLYIC